MLGAVITCAWMEQFKNSCFCSKERELSEMALEWPQLMSIKRLCAKHCLKPVACNFCRFVLTEWMQQKASLINTCPPMPGTGEGEELGFLLFRFVPVPTTTCDGHRYFIPILQMRKQAPRS